MLVKSFPIFWLLQHRHKRCLNLSGGMPECELDKSLSQGAICWPPEMKYVPKGTRTRKPTARCLAHQSHHNLEIDLYLLFADQSFLLRNFIFVWSYCFLDFWNHWVKGWILLSALNLNELSLFCGLEYLSLGTFLQSQDLLLKMPIFD